MKIYVLPFWVLVVLGGVVFAQEESESKDSGHDLQSSSETQTEYDLNEQKAAFRELVCARAADISSPLQTQAISIAREHRYIDERFDAAIYRVMREVLEPEKWETAAVSNALNLLPLSKLDPKVQSKLVFECYNHASTQLPILKRSRVSTRSTELIIERLKKFLSEHPAELTELIKQGLKSKDLPNSAYTLFAKIGEKGIPLLPMVLEVAHSEDPEVASRALNAANNLLRQSQASAPIVAAKAAVVAPIDAKITKYAEAIISRYDVNKDGFLTEDESEKMLMPVPKSADLNGDRLITANEYGFYMQSKSKR